MLKTRKLVGRWSQAGPSHGAEAFWLPKLAPAPQLVRRGPRRHRLPGPAGPERCNPPHAITPLLLCPNAGYGIAVCVPTDCVLARFQPISQTKINHHNYIDIEYVFRRYQKK